MGDKLLQYATRNQWGYQLQQGCQGLAQAQAAVQTALAATVEGDLDWHVPGWGQAVVFLLEDAEQLLQEEGQLDFVHPADVAALSEGHKKRHHSRWGLGATAGHATPQHQGGHAVRRGGT